MNLVEREIWERIREGDLKSFQLIFNSYFKGLVAYAYDFIKNREECEEIVLEAFALIWSERLQIKIHTSLKAYLYRSVHNHCINFIKHVEVMKRKSSEYILQVQRDSEIILNNMGEFALDNLIALELEKEIEIAITALPHQCREVFYLSRFRQMKIKDIAHKMNLSQSTVKTYLSRALEKLRDSLGSHLSEKS